MGSTLKLKRFFSALPILVSVILGLLAFQSLALGFHQGKHFSQFIQSETTQGPSLDEGACVPCSVLHIPLDSAFSVSFDSKVLPCVARVVSQGSSDPKAPLQRICEARGPPSSG
jgi:hypothetical protein